MIQERGFTTIRSPDSSADLGTSIRNDQRIAVDVTSVVPSSSTSVSYHPDTTTIAHWSFPILETISRGLQSRLPSLLVVDHAESVYHASVWNCTVHPAIGPSSIKPVAKVVIVCIGGLLVVDVVEVGPLDHPHPPPQAVSPRTRAAVTSLFFKKNLFHLEIERDCGTCEYFEAKFFIIIQISEKNTIGLEI